MIVGETSFTATAVVAVNLLVDAVYAVLDPRISCDSPPPGRRPDRPAARRGRDGPFRLPRGAACPCV